MADRDPVECFTCNQPATDDALLKACPHCGTAFHEGCAVMVLAPDLAGAAMRCPACREQIPASPGHEPSPKLRPIGERPGVKRGPALIDPLLALRRFLGSLLLVSFVACLVCEAASVAGQAQPKDDTLSQTLAGVLSQLALMSLSLFVGSAWLRSPLPNRPVDALYLRPFARDGLTVKMKRVIQSILGPRHRLAGIRPPRRRLPFLLRYVLAYVFLYRYMNPRFMELEAGEDWLRRVENTMRRVDWVFIDVADMTQHVADEVRVALRTVDHRRLIFLAREPGHDDPHASVAKQVAGLAPQSTPPRSLTVIAWRGDARLFRSELSEWLGRDRAQTETKAAGAESDPKESRWLSAFVAAVSFYLLLGLMSAGPAGALVARCILSIFLGALVLGQLCYFPDFFRNLVFFRDRVFYVLYFLITLAGGALAAAIAVAGQGP